MLVAWKSNSQSWTYVTPTGTTFILYGMSFPPGQNMIGYACGMQYTYDADGVIVKTTDGGNSWSQIWPASGTIDGLQGIWFYDPVCKIIRVDKADDPPANISNDRGLLSRATI